MIVLVVGTGTDVGKTHVTCALLAAMASASNKRRVSAWKPVLTGVPSARRDYPFSDSDPTDVDRHARYLDHAPEPPLFVFAPPVSPHLAARAVGEHLDVNAFAEAAVRFAEHTDVLFVEGAGGLFSPIGDESTHVELAFALSKRSPAPVKTLLVAPDRLGVLHDLRATLLAARHVGLSLDAVVLSAPAIPDASTGRNGAELSRLGIVPIAAEFPRAAPDDEDTTLAAFATYRGLGLGLHLDDTARR